MTDSSRKAFEAWWRERLPSLDYTRAENYDCSTAEAETIWQASRLAALEEAAKACKAVESEMTTEAESKFLTDAGRSAYTSAAMGAKSCLAAVRALAPGMEGEGK